MSQVTKVGDIEILPIHDGVGVENAGRILSRASVPDAWRCHPDQFGHDGHWELPVGGFCVRTGDRVVLVDTGVGAIDENGYTGGGLLDSLRTAGIAPEDVTDVVFTHLHFDHVGWATHNGEVVFPNATYRAHRADWEYFVTGPEATEQAIEKLLPIKPQLELFDAEFTVAPGIDARPVPGHTPGSTVYVVSSGDQRAVLLGDVAHSTVQFTDRDWQVIWDVDPAAATAVRNRLAGESADTDDLVVAAHFPEMRFGRLITNNSAWKFVAE